MVREPLRNGLGLWKETKKHAENEFSGKIYFTGS
jgi:hypothetical protein